MIVKNAGKTAGILILAAFSAMALSVLCLASIQSQPMSDCSGSHGAPALCPFMSASLPAVFNTGLSAEIIAAIAFIFALFAITPSLNAEGALASEKIRRLDNSRGRPKDTVIELISRGILHSRVFSF